VTKFFSLGSSDAGRTYPLKDGNPKQVLLLDPATATLLDIDHWVNPQTLGCDAYVLTDSGVHLFYVAPNKPDSVVAAQADPLHIKLNVAGQGQPCFYESKETGRPRSCVALTRPGFALALEYNTTAMRLHVARLDAEAEAANLKHEACQALHPQKVYCSNCFPL